MSDKEFDVTKLAALLRKFKAMEAVGISDAQRRDELLDELQDAAGLAGRMVMERDILRRAEQLLRSE